MRIAKISLPLAGSVVCPCLYNFCSDMQTPRYALVAYLKNPVGEFVETSAGSCIPNTPISPPT